MNWKHLTTVAALFLVGVCGWLLWCFSGAAAPPSVPPEGGLAGAGADDRVGSIAPAQAGGVAAYAVRTAVDEESILGQVAFLDAASLEPISPAGWLARQAGGDWRTLPGSADGVLQLARAVWEFQPAQGLTILEAKVDLRVDTQRIVWVQRKVEVQIVVTSRGDGAPIREARIGFASWSSRGAEEAEHGARRFQWSSDTITDAAGRARIGDLQLPCALRVVAAGFDPLLIDVGMVDGPLQVAMDESRPDSIRMSVVDGESGSPVGPIAIGSWCGGFEVTREDGGVVALKLPSTLSPEDRLVVEAEGFAPVVVVVDRLRAADGGVPKVVLRRLCTLVVHGEATAEDPWQVWVRGAVETGSVGLPFEDHVRVHEGPVRRAIPVGARLEVLGRTARGDCHEASMLPHPGENVLTLGAAGPILRLVLEPAAAPRVAGVGGLRSTAEVRLTGGLPGFQVDAAGGALVIPHPSRVSSITVRMAGHEAVRLRRVADATIDPAGSLALPLSIAHPVRLNVVDDQDRPIPGLRLLLAGAERESSRRMTTGHGAWTVELRSPVPVLTDGRGVASLRLVEGAYLGMVQLPREVVGAPGAIHYAGQSVRFQVAGAGEHRLVVDPPRKIAILATDGATGQPLRKVLVRAAGIADLEPVAAIGRAIWLPRSCGRITLDAPGYLSAAVDLHPEVPVAPIVMHAGGVGTLVLEGPHAGSLRGATLVLRSRDPRGNRGRSVVSVDDPSAVRIELAGAQLEVSIDPAEAGDRRWRFEPMVSRWDAGGVLRFRPMLDEAGK